MTWSRSERHGCSVRLLVARINLIKQEPGLTNSRLAMLIDSLASGADVYSSATPTGGNGVNEMEVVLDS